jgi:flavin reductase (DIM6/NTAB) family NADH-FMN oxidoreductase RutF
MFFTTTPGEGEPRNGGLPWDPFKALVAPRPIGWITTLSPEGVVNLAPFSFFNVVGDKPNMVFFAPGERLTGGMKDSQRNAELSGEFVCNLATWDLREEMNLTSAAVDPDVDETALAELAMTPSRLVAPPRVARAPAALECVYVDTYVPRAKTGRLHRSRLVFGEVVGVHIDDAYIREGRVDTAAMRPIARMGYDEYAVIDSAFRMQRPDVDILARLETPR